MLIHELIRPGNLKNYMAVWTLSKRKNVLLLFFLVEINFFCCWKKKHIFKSFNTSFICDMVTDYVFVLQVEQKKFSFFFCHLDLFNKYSTGLLSYDRDLDRCRLGGERSRRDGGERLEPW